MIRLHEFITKIRNCKTQAQERAEYQKEMAAIRESFAKNQDTLRPRNVTKLLFINMSGQQTNFGQMECLKLISNNSLIEKRIGYLGLTQLFHEKSQLLMMATNRIRIDLSSNNNNIVGLVLCVLSEICTSELARDLHQDVLKCISNNSAYIRKKAILTSIKVIKRVPEYISQFLPKISTCLEEKSHGVLLSCMAFLENVIQVDESFANNLVDLVPKIARAYRLIAQEHNAQYEIGGVQDPFLQVAILKFLRTLRKHSNNFDKQLAEILVICHDSVCSRVSNNLKNGANAVLFECFQCFMQLEPTPQLRQMVANVLTKFISVKDANSKYLSLFNLNLMTKYDLKIVKTHRSTIFECMNQNDILIRIMALDLLYVIAAPDNSPSIVKDLLNVLLTANDQEFITQLALKICLIVQKHSQSRRWHFDTILKVLVYADQAVKQESAKSLVYLVQSTPQLQEYCMAKLFFASVQNPQNDALSSMTLFLIGQLSHILFKINAVKINEKNILDLIESIIFKVGITNDTIAYGLSSLLKLYQKFGDKTRISKMIKSFETHSDLQVQKRACQYAKLIQHNWDEDRKKEICIPVQPFKPTVQTFKSIPIGELQMDLDLSTLKMPNPLGVNYDQHIIKGQTPSEVRQVKMGRKEQETKQPEQAKVQLSKPVQVEKKTDQPKKTASLLDEQDQIISAPTKIPDVKQQTQSTDIFGNTLGGFSFEQAVTTPPVVTPPPVQNNDPFNIFGLEISSPQVPQPVSMPNAGFGGDLLGFGSISTPPQPVSQPTPQPTVNTGFGADLMGFGISSPQPVSQPQPTNLGFNFGITSTPTVPQAPQPQPQNNFGINLLGATTAPISQPTLNPTVNQVNTGFKPIINTNPNKFLAYENQHIQIWMDCIKEGADSSKIYTTYINKTNNSLAQLAFQAAVLKHVKLTINSLSAMILQPYSSEVVHQTLHVVNSMAGQKGVVMKIKLAYAINNQNFNFEEKISNFPVWV